MMYNIFKKCGRPKSDRVAAHYPLISVCIPVYDTEIYLERCLHSAIVQDYPNFEIVIVSDHSRGRDGRGRDARRIIADMQKECSKLRKKCGLPKVDFVFREHRENRGLIEVRRTLMYEASGEYMTQLDSDDMLEDGALSKLAAPILWAVGGEVIIPDIVHGTSTAGVFGDDGTFTPTSFNRYGTITYETITGHDIFRRWLLEGAFTANTWGKLIKRELFVKAYSHIPYTECNMADDILLFFFLAQYATCYIGIPDKVYRYGVSTGMTSARKIDTLHKWKMVCSAASVFTVLVSWIEEEQAAGRRPLADDEINNLRLRTSFYLENNLRQLKDTVVPELQADARQMLCDYWGEHFVDKVEANLAKKR